MPALSRWFLALAFCWPVAAGAAPPVKVRLHVEGSCPSVSALRGRLASVAGLTLDDGAAWILRVRGAGRGPVAVRLVAPGGETSLERQVQSRDCGALAGAVAIIVEAHFLSLGLGVAAPPATRPASRPTPATIPASLPPADRPRPPIRGPSRPTTATPSRGGRLMLWALPSAGARVTLAPSEVSGAFGLRLAGRWSTLPLVVGLGAVLTTPVEAGQASERVRLLQGTARLEAGLDLWAACRSSIGTCSCSWIWRAAP